MELITNVNGIEDPLSTKINDVNTKVEGLTRKLESIVDAKEKLTMKINDRVDTKISELTATMNVIEVKVGKLSMSIDENIDTKIKELMDKKEEELKMKMNDVSLVFSYIFVIIQPFYLITCNTSLLSYFMHMHLAVS